MSSFENLGENKVKVTFHVGPERFEEGLKYSYNRNKTNFSVPGFRKGKVPRKMLESQYGKELFFEDAINFVLQDAYENAISELKLKVVSKPEIDATEVSVDTGIVFIAEVYVSPEIDIDGYLGLSYRPFPTEPTEKEVEDVINADRDKNARIITVEDRATQLGDILTIDFEGFIDGIAFEGGKGENHELTLGSKSFIDNFEDQLTDHYVNDHVDVNVTFPENYGNAEYAGKQAWFVVEIKDARYKELPEANDDFAQDVSEFDTFDEYKNSIVERIRHDKEHRAEHYKEDQLTDQLVVKVTADIPQVMVENSIDSMIANARADMRQQGLTLEMYLQYIGQTIDSYKESCRPHAEKSVKCRLALESVAKKEGIAITDEDIADELTKRFGPEITADKLNDEIKQMLAEDISVSKAMELVMQNAIENTEEIEAAEIVDEVVEGEVI